MKVYGGIDCIDTIGDRFSIRAELPDAVMPALDWEAIKNLFPVAITIAVLGAIESLLSATVADGVIGDKHDSNTELISTRCCQHGYPAVWRYPCHRSHRAYHGKYRQRRKNSRSRHGACSGIAAYPTVSSMPLAQYIPMACLAGVLVIVSYNMSGWRTFKALLKNPKWDVTVLLITFFLTVILT